MEWMDIRNELLEDPMIACQGCDGLWDAYHALDGLYHMYELHVNLTDEFILEVEVINASIDGRNRYCSLDGSKELPHVIIEDGEFLWEYC